MKTATVVPRKHYKQKSCQRLQFMGGVNRNDEMISKWYKKLVTQVLEGLIKAYMLHWKFGGPEPKGHSDYQKILLFATLQDGQRRRLQLAQMVPDVAVPGLRHAPSSIPSTARKEKPQKRCIVCWKRGVSRQCV